MIFSIDMSDSFLKLKFLADQVVIYFRFHGQNSRASQCNLYVKNVLKF